MTVVDMSQWREEQTPDVLVCVCGSAWFELREGAVTMNADRSVTGYSGTPVCIECGRAK